MTGSGGQGRPPQSGTWTRERTNGTSTRAVQPPDYQPVDRDTVDQHQELAMDAQIANDQRLPAQLGWPLTDFEDPDGHLPHDTQP